MKTITTVNFVTDTLTAVDQVIAHFVHTVYFQLMQHHRGTFTLLATFYILLLGYRFTVHTLSADLNTLSRHLIVLVIVYGLMMNWSLYQLFIYNIFTNEPGHLAQMLVNASGPFLQSKTVGYALNQVYSTGMNAANQLFNVFSLRLFCCSIAMIGFTFLCCLAALGLLIYAKLAMAIGLALGPLFIPFLLWESTRGWFVSWLRKLFNFALIPVITAGILALMLSIMNLVLPDLHQQAVKGEPDFFTITLFGGLSLMTAFLLKQSLPIASSLSGGLTLAALGQVGDMLRSTLQTTGVHSATRLAGKGLQSARRALSRQANTQKHSDIHFSVDQGKNKKRNK